MHTTRVGRPFGLVLTLLVPDFTHAEAVAQPLPEHGLHYDTPAMVWDEALPLGNGTLGALVWGDGQPLKISLDRTDLWDLRPVPQFESEDYSYATMREWVREGRIDDLHKLYDDPYGNAGPTKIPAGRIELTFPRALTFRDSRLDLSAATASIAFDTGISVDVLVHATLPIGMINTEGASEVDAHLVVPPFAGDVKDPAGLGKISAGDLASLGYSPPELASGQHWTGTLQEGWGGFRFAVTLAWRARPSGWLGVWSIATSNESPDPLSLALKRCEEALALDFADHTDTHGRWWEAYWDRSAVHLPNATLERQWYLETYKFGAATRSDAPPITLQGPWTADNGKIPPWKGDYHHDLNTELCYWPCYTGNRLHEGLGFVEWLWQTRDNARAWTRRFFAKPGLNVPMTADLNNNQIGGWHQYTHSCTTAAWLAQHFYLHWRYSMDRVFLRERAYPFLSEAAVFLEAITEKDAAGKRTLPLSSSPEINDDRIDAWFPTITNYDLALIRWLFATTAELADEVGEAQSARHWREVLDETPDLATAPEDSRLLVAAGYPLPHSHRHFSHLMAIHPLGLMRWENGERDQATIRAALEELDRLGTRWWTGYSFSWLACLAARARDGARAERALEIFSTAFCLRNSFHCNGDQSGKGYSEFRYRPFTLEGNFAAAAAIQEMLLQSFSGIVRVFPAVPETWQDVAFEKLRAEGAFLVSAERRDGVVVEVTIRAEKDGTCRLADPFGGAAFDIEGMPDHEIQRVGHELHFQLATGQALRFRRRAASEHEENS
ncbi:MAG: glycoside hydrolase N-terminal domain-containing protein [Planctomycetota bacterium]